ncbi:rolling circle replication-associated protein [Vallitalea okinawensis]
MTLTFDDNKVNGKFDITDVQQCNDQFRKFIMRFNYQVRKEDENYKLRYVAVMEFQDENNRGAIHYHCIFFNMPFIKWDVFKDKIWKLGGVWLDCIGKKDGLYINKDREDMTAQNTSDRLKNVGAYITKTMQYMLKEENIVRLAGEKSYLCSKGLDKPIIMTNNCNKYGWMDDEIEFMVGKSLEKTNNYLINESEYEIPQTLNGCKARDYIYQGNKKNAIKRITFNDIK